MHFVLAECCHIKFVYILRDFSRVSKQLRCRYYSAICGLFCQLSRKGENFGSSSPAKSTLSFPREQSRIFAPFNNTGFCMHRIANALRSSRTIIIIIIFRWLSLAYSHRTVSSAGIQNNNSNCCRSPEHKKCAVCAHQRSE